MKNESFAQMMLVIKKYQKKPPVDVTSIAYDLGIRVHYQNDWPDKLSGKIARNEEEGGKSGFAIYINSNHAETRQRFTLAHEIAHFILHRDEIGKKGIADDALYRSGLSSAKEVMANRLAADILMPTELVKEQLREGVNSVEELAKLFNVSSSAMAIRLGVPSAH